MGIIYMKKTIFKRILGISALSSFVFIFVLLFYVMSRMSIFDLILCSANQGGIRLPSGVCEYYMKNYRADEDDLQELAIGGIDPILNLDNEAKKYEIAEFFISKGLNIDGVNHYYNESMNDSTPLHASALYNDTKRAKFLIAHGANVEARSKYHNNMTPLELARYLQKNNQKDMNELIQILSKSGD